MMQKITSALKSPVFWVGALVGVVLAIAYVRFIPAIVKKAASKLPGAQA